MSQGRWQSTNEQMKTIENMFRTGHFKDKSYAEKVKRIEQRLGINHVTARRRLDRYNLYQKMISLGRHQDARRLAWNPGQDAIHISD